VPWAIESSQQIVLTQLRELVRGRRTVSNSPTSERAQELLMCALGPEASFRDGQLRAISAIVEDRARLLVVERTGWGKSLVYFLATQLLREQGAGPTLLISPLLSLMRNQLEMAERIGVQAVCLTSENRADWRGIEQAIVRNEIDLLMISPERLSNQDFNQRVLCNLPAGMGLLAVDEAHCISDWGHDFRPDFRRIRQVADALPDETPILATTATVNRRVIEDIQEQLGRSTRTQRGSLERESLRLQVIELPDQSLRLAWLATYLPALSGTGIIYCLTKRDTELVSSFLHRHGIDAPAYHADLDPTLRAHREGQLVRNEVKALCATVALGMGFDKPDLGFVVHYQRPGSLLAYYQQVGRAGRATTDAIAILLAGEEDDRIELHFMESAFPDAMSIVRVLRALHAGRVSHEELERHVNLSRTALDQCLRFLEVEGAVQRNGSYYERSHNRWSPDVDRWRRVTAQREAELQRMRAFGKTRECLMRFVIRELGDPKRTTCGHCANCAGEIVPRQVSKSLADEAQHFLATQWVRIDRRTVLPFDILPSRPRQIPLDRLNEIGLALCEYNSSGWGALITQGKYKDGRFDDTLVVAAGEAIQSNWPIDDTWWIAPVPSLRHPQLVFDFSRRIGNLLGIEVVPALTKARDTEEQKRMESASKQCMNVIDAFRVSSEHVRPGPVLLVDDIVDSGWTLTVCGAALRKSGAGPVHPFALAAQRRTFDQ
jgi:ATP-dependent DNA helicase RecQ